jgi:AcrR family transcriptional regulator
MTNTVARRREVRTAEIVASAWHLARQQGIAAVTLRALANEVGIRQPSLYEYFDSKHALYDAMFADGYRRMLDEVSRIEIADDPREAFKQVARFMLQVSTDDIPRYQLLFTRTIPGFEPSEQSYALALEFLEQGRTRAAAAGIRGDRDFDLYTAIVAGLTSQQLANEPGGDRWLRLLDEALDLLLDRAAARRADGTIRNVTSKGGR